VESPPLLKLATSAEYEAHYKRHYCRGEVYTFDGIRVYFKPQKFGHAFYKNSQRRKGAKDAFSPERAQRMDWIKHALQDQDAELYQGWNKDDRVYVEDRRVSVILGDFVTVIELSLNQKGELKGNFVTCYVADNSIASIKQSPQWDREQCLEKLRRK